MMKSPCLGCDKRNVKCHIECEEYNKFKEERKHISKERVKENENRTLLFRPSHYK